MNAIVGNWDVNGILWVQSGQPIGIAGPRWTMAKAQTRSPRKMTSGSRHVLTVAPPFAFKTKKWSRLQYPKTCSLPNAMRNVNASHET